MPRLRRPPLMWSSVAAIFPVMHGLRYVLPLTRWPIRARVVTCASAPSVVQLFEAGPLGIDEDRVEMIEGPQRVVAPAVVAFVQMSSSCAHSMFCWPVWIRSGSDAPSCPPPAPTMAAVSLEGNTVRKGEETTRVTNPEFSTGPSGRAFEPNGRASAVTDGERESESRI